ncbi:Esterase, SGNH hydrolase-type [Acrodontium crateriforme]|uniref:Esterase, SGNH hydrolase-type n=1 Tax=Acrodontium crateriforme TaxID=150365 RepID=A0AAQ3R926_9PEZI|nr:Esterase, SGNH hydrolase-type [Acrodontium crateriforme]
MSFFRWATGALLALNIFPNVASARHNAVPLPKDPFNGMDYSKLADLIAAMPAPPSNEPPAFVPQTYPTNINEKRAGGTKVMIVGDSMTQGLEGDWTWRYRIWQWAQVNNLGWDFVGPYTGTRNPPKTQPPQPEPLYGSKAPNGGIIATGGYAAGVDPAFDSDHFSIWGRAMAEDVGEIHDVVAAHPPDIMLVMLGFNDIGWFYSDAQGLFDNLGLFLTKAREAKPDIKFVIANVPQRTSLGREDLPEQTTKYNQILSDNIASLGNDQSPCYLVHLQENYNCGLDSCPAGYDGLHPNSVGEYQIASAFSKTLFNDMKIGSGPLAIPANIPSRPVPVPSNFQVQTSPQGWTATWDQVYGAISYNVRTRIPGLTDWAVANTAMHRFDPQWPVANSTYEAQVQVSCGENCAGDWSAVGSAKCVPQTPAAPQNAHVSSSGSSITVSWDASPGDIIQYDVIWWDLTQPCSWLGGGGFKSSPATVDGLVQGHKYMVGVSGFNANGEGFPTLLNSIIIGAGAPGTATGLKIIANDATTAHLTWDPVANAAGYHVYTRNTANASDVSTLQPWTQDEPCADDGWLFPGVWNYEFCIQAFNGDQVGPKGNCVIAPSPTSGVVAASCSPTGHQFSGCAFGAVPTFTDHPTSPSTPGPTASPTSSPMHQKPDPTTTATKPYMSISCNSDAVKNAGRPGVDMSTYWETLDCQDAWTDVETNWENEPHFSSYEFTKEMAHTFDQTAPEWNCQNLTFNGPTNCKVPISCDSVNSPAGWFIMNGVVGLEGVISSVAGTLTISSTYASEQASDLVSAFGNVDDGKLQAILGIVSLGLGVLGTPQFGDLIKELNNVQKGLGDTISAVKDATTNLAGQSIATVNQAVAGGQTGVSEQNSLEVNIANIIGTWQQALTDYNTQLFNGSPDSIVAILHYIVDGTFFTGNTVPTLTQKSWLDRALYPLLINYLWSLGEAPVFLMDVNKPCDAKNPPSAPISGNKTETYHCVNGNSYYLASAKGSAYSPSGCNPSNPRQQCSSADFSEPPGLSTLQPGNKWGGVTPEDLATGSVQTWLSNGRKNGVDNSKTYASDIIGQIYDVYSNPNAIFQLPGFFNLPVCSADEARSNWKETSFAGRAKTANYPCNQKLFLGTCFGLLLVEFNEPSAVLTSSRTDPFARCSLTVF